MAIEILKEVLQNLSARLNGSRATENCERLLIIVLLYSTFATFLFLPCMSLLFFFLKRCQRSLKQFAINLNNLPCQPEYVRFIFLFLTLKALKYCLCSLSCWKALNRIHFLMTTKKTIPGKKNHWELPFVYFCQLSHLTHLHIKLSSVASR